MSSGRTPRRCSRIAVTLTLACTALALIASRADAQDPWSTRLSASPSPVAIGLCGTVSLELSDASTRDAPRNPQGWRVSLADFDLSVRADDPRALVGKYNGAASYSVCACQAATAGASATITATYPAQSLAEKSRVAGVAYSVSIPITTTARIGTIEPRGCPAMTSTGVAVAQSSMKQTSAIIPVSMRAAGTPSVGLPAGGTLGAAPIGTVTSDPGAPAGGSVASATSSEGSVTSSGGLTKGREIAGTSGPAPTGLAISGTPTTAKLSWVAAPGATSYSVRRWNPANPACCENSVTGLTQPAWSDAGFPVPGPYSYVVTGISATGAQGSVNGTFTPPAPRNATSFVATQTSEDVVTLTWSAAPFASYYLLWGAGLPNTGVQVTGTSQILRNVPPGAQSWSIGAFYAPGPVSTVASAFPKATTTVVSACDKLFSAGAGPQSVTSLPGALNGAALYWSLVPGAVAYTVDRMNKTMGGSWVRIASSCAGARQQVVTTGATGVAPLPANSAGILDTTGAEYATTYRYRVQAITASGAMGWNSVDWTQKNKFALYFDSTSVSGSTLTVNARYPWASEYVRPAELIMSYSSGGEMRMEWGFGAGFMTLAITSVPEGSQEYTLTGVWKFLWNGVSTPIATSTYTKTVTITP